MPPPPSDAGGLRPPQQRSRVFWNTEPLLRNGDRKVSDEFSLRPTRDPSARRRKLTPDAKHPSGHPRLRRPKGALCFTRRPPRIRKSVRSSNGDCPRALSCCEVAVIGVSIARTPPVCIELLRDESRRLPYTRGCPSSDSMQSVPSRPH